MSLIDGKPVPLHPTACGNCRWWAPWLRQQEFLGTCGQQGVNLGQCTDKHGTCDQFEGKK